jgi:hypothetical protein
MMLGNTDGLRRGEHLSERMENDERDETFEFFRDYAGGRLDVLQRQEREGTLGRGPDLRSMIRFAIEENATLAALLTDVYKAVQVNPADGLHARKILSDVCGLFQEFKESTE